MRRTKAGFRNTFEMNFGYNLICIYIVVEKGTTLPVCCNRLNFHLYDHLSYVYNLPLIAAAAAIAGDTRWVRAPLP